MATLQAYNYTDLMIAMQIPPEYCTGTLKVTFSPSSGTPVSVDTTDYDSSTGIVIATLTQAQSANLHGIVGVQINGFLNSMRWASEIAYFQCDNNLYEEILS